MDRETADCVKALVSKPSTHGLQNGPGEVMNQYLLMHDTFIDDEEKAAINTLIASEKEGSLC